MAKTKKVRISNNKIDEIVKMANTETTVSWNGIEFHVKRTVSLQDEINIIVSAVDSAFGDDGRYNPEAAEMSMYIGVIYSYTDIQLPEDLMKQYDLIFRTDIMTVILESIDRDQIDRIKASVDERIDYLRNSSILSAEFHIAETTAKLERIFEKLNDVFSDISHEDMEAVINSVRTLDGVDEEKMLKAYAEAAIGK